MNLHFDFVRNRSHVQPNRQDDLTAPSPTNEHTRGLASKLSSSNLASDRKISSGRPGNTSNRGGSTSTQNNKQSFVFAHDVKVSVLSICSSSRMRMTCLHKCYRSKTMLWIWTLLLVRMNSRRAHSQARSKSSVQQRLKTVGVQMGQTVTVSCRVDDLLILLRNIDRAALHTFDFVLFLWLFLDVRATPVNALMTTDGTVGSKLETLVGNTSTTKGSVLNVKQGSSHLQ